jgi:hypothetical protein
MTDKGADTVQVKLRVPTRIRRQVLAAAKKSGRSLSSELNHLIETGLANPGDVPLITKVAEMAAREAALRMALALLPALEETPQGREALKAAAASVRSPPAASPWWERSQTVAVPAVPMVDKSEIELQLRDIARELAAFERALNDEKDPHLREELRRLIKIYKEKERNFRALSKTISPQGAEK